MPSVGTAAQRPAFPPAREILPGAGETAVTAIPGHGNVYVITSPIGSPPNFSGILASEFHVR
jgi:hypothetical protein